MSAPFAYVAHKDGKLGGICATDVDTQSLGKFIVDFATDGFTLTPMANREQYLAFIKDMPMYGDHSAGTLAPLADRGES